MEKIFVFFITKLGLLHRGWQIWFPPPTLSRWVLHLEFGVVFRMLIWLDSFNGNFFVFGELFWRSVKLQLNDRAASISEEVCCALSFGWPLRCCRRWVMDVGILLRGFLDQDCNFPPLSFAKVRNSHLSTWSYNLIFIL